MQTGRNHHVLVFQAVWLAAETQRVSVLAGYLSEAQPQELQGLLGALQQECPQEIVPYQDLFLQDTELNQVCCGPLTQCQV